MKPESMRKQAKQIQEQLKVPQNGKSYSLKASSTMAKSENLVKSHVQLQNEESQKASEPAEVTYEVVVAAAEVGQEEANGRWMGVDVEAASKQSGSGWALKVMKSSIESQRAKS
ncbi:hypothetical protein P7K49_023773 [Saguinus oedipus]|uniref:Uncharacterized protein n=1 Tax=Saguinus oedipus TaxID=9490 RepID=A0ABQ9UMM8_SAGOE|nr:hypothetical protein P7K49_023773 [Saguinus oedipus]